LSPEVEEEQESSGEESSLSSSVLSPPSSSRTADEDFDFLAPAFGFPQSWPISFFNSFALALLCLWLQVAAGFDVVGFEEWPAVGADFFSSLEAVAGTLLLEVVLGFTLEGGSGIGSRASDFGRDGPDSPAGVTLIPSLAFEVTLIPSLVFDVTLIPSLLSVVTLIPSFSNFLGSEALVGNEVVSTEGRESATSVALWASEVAEGEEGREELEEKAPVVEDKLKEVGIVDDREEEETVVEA
jgi:hypothetical protein